MIKIDLSALVHAKNGHRKVIVLDFGAFSLDQLTLSYLRGELHLTRVNSGILVKGALESEAVIECTRCLTLFSEPLLIELEDVISLPGALLTPERPVRVTEDGWADLAPLVREYLWVVMPSNPVCTPQCHGICPECGGNINLGECVCEAASSVDPRWEALRALLSDSAEQT